MGIDVVPDGTHTRRHATNFPNLFTPYVVALRHIRALVTFVQDDP